MSMGSNPVFPIMFYNYNISYSINLININKLHKNLTFYIIFSKKNLVFLNFLKNFNFIHKYILIKKNNRLLIKIYLYYYKNKKISPFFKLISKPSKNFFVSYKILRLLSKRTAGSIFIISTSKGLLSHHEAIKNKVSGKLIAFFSL